MVKLTQKNIIFLSIVLVIAPYVPRYDRGYSGDDYSERLLFLAAVQERELELENEQQ